MQSEKPDADARHLLTCLGGAFRRRAAQPATFNKRRRYFICAYSYFLKHMEQRASHFRNRMAATPIPAFSAAEASRGVSALKK